MERKRKQWMVNEQKRLLAQQRGMASNKFRSDAAVPQCFGDALVKICQLGMFEKEEGIGN